MNPLRFSLAKLFGFVAAVAVALGALVNATWWWAAMIYTIALVALLLGIAGIVYGRRLFWIGFVAVGGGYFALVFIPPMFSGAAQVNARARLAPTKLLDYLHSKVAHTFVPLTEEGLVVWFRADGTTWVNGEAVEERDLLAKVNDLRQPTQEVVVYTDPRPVDSNRIEALQKTNLVKRYSNASDRPTYTDFVEAGHALFCLLFAWLGGVLAVCCFGKREKKP